MTWRMWTQNYENIKWVQGASVKTKIVKCRFQDQEDAGTTPEDENSIEVAGGAAAAATPAAGAAEAAPPAGGEETAAAPAFAEPAPSPPERRRDGMVRGLRADAD